MIPRRLLVLLPLVLVAAAIATAQTAGPPPAELMALVAKARLEAPIVAWCRGELRPGRRGSFAVAAGATAGGRYLAIDVDGSVVELAAYTDKPDLACYTRSEAERLNESIRRSETIQGQLVPRWPTTVVCGFVDATRAVCWQYSPSGRTFVAVGYWTT